MVLNFLRVLSIESWAGPALHFRELSLDCKLSTRCPRGSLPYHRSTFRFPNGGIQINLQSPNGFRTSDWLGFLFGPA